MGPIPAIGSIVCIVSVMRRILFSAFFIIIVAGIGAAVWFLYDPVMDRLQPPVPTPIVASATPLPITQKHTVVLLQERDTERRIMVCAPKSCQPSLPPESAQGEAVFDGESWYRYRLVEKQKGQQSALLLERVWVKDQYAEPIVEQTPLVRPRDLYISPDGKRVAYWLDNIDQPKEKLTELWVYDSEIGSTRLVVEKVKQEDVISPIRWNRASSHLWFMASAQQETKIVVAGVKPVERITSFDHLPWKTLEGIASFGIMDLSLSGENVAYVETKETRSELVIARKNSRSEYTTVKGSVPYVEWLSDGSLVYARQEQSGFTFWRVQGKAHRHIAQQPGILRSARSDSAGETVLLTADKVTGGSYLATMRLGDGYIVPMGDIPAFGETNKIVQIREEIGAQPSQVAGLSSALSDEELVPFIEKNISTIVGGAAATPNRIIVTDQANTLYVDYRQGTENGRVLVTVRDAVHPEWSIRGRYKDVQGDWKKIEGSGLTDPGSKRVYEWEASVKQWILKSG